MQRLTATGIKRYLLDTYGEVRHDVERMKNTCQYIARKYKCKSVDVFHFMVEQKPIPSLYTHSYGFNTALGREIRGEFTNEYYSQ